MSASETTGVTPAAGSSPLGGVGEEVAASIPSLAATIPAEYDDGNGCFGPCCCAPEVHS